MLNNKLKIGGGIYMNAYTYTAMIIALVTVIAGSTHFLLGIGTGLLKNMINLQTDTESSKIDAIMADCLYALVGFISFCVVSSIYAKIPNKSELKTKAINLSNIEWMNTTVQVWFFIIIFTTLICMISFKKIVLKFLRKEKTLKPLEVILSSLSSIVIIISAIMISFIFYYYSSKKDIASIVILIAGCSILTFVSFGLVQIFANIYKLKEVTLTYNDKSSLKTKCKIIMEHGDFFVVTQDGESFVYLNKKNIEIICPVGDRNKANK